MQKNSRFITLLLVNLILSNSVILILVGANGDTGLHAAFYCAGSSILITVFLRILNNIFISTSNKLVRILTTLTFAFLSAYFSLVIAAIIITWDIISINTIVNDFLLNILVALVFAVLWVPMGIVNYFLLRWSIASSVKIKN